ncbi:Asp23/Gls24 family envelope stress response protein [Pseudonocardia sp. CA-107938]|uniref:Asp23/Gls24 family envelope stress response protein n=1 Tax=Pseudonocardia sp. CA-107938 TaxID=3240021 RepID=UPI003D8B896E
MTGPPGALPEPGERGALDIDPVVLRKVIEYAADQVPGTMRHGRRLAGIDVGESGARARVVTGNGDPTAVDVRLEVTLRYPGEIRTVVDAVRTKVDDELARITGHHVRSLAVTVAGLRTATRAAPARLQ